MTGACELGPVETRQQWLSCILSRVSVMAFFTNETAMPSCFEESTNDSYIRQPSPALEKTFMIVQLLYHISTVPWTFMLNTIVIVVIATTKSLQTAPFLTALQLAGFDLVFSVVNLLSVISSVIGGGWVLGVPLCVVFTVITNGFNLIRLLLLTIIAIDRFLYVFAPIKYPKMYVKLTVALTSFSWLLVSLISVLILPGVLDCTGYVPLYVSCHIIGCSRPCLVLIYVGLFFIIFPSCVLPAVLYTCLYCKARRLRNRSNSSSDNSRSNNKAAVTFFLVFLTTILLTLPLSLLAILDDILSNSESTSQMFILLSVLSFRLVLIADPIFILRNENVKLAFFKLSTSKVWRQAMRMFTKEAL